MITRLARRTLRAPTCRALASLAADKATSAAAASGAAAASKNTLPPYAVFDRAAKLRQRERAASSAETSRQVDYLRDEVAQRVADRLLDIKRRFGTIVELGAGSGLLVKHLDAEVTDKVIMCDSSRGALFRDAAGGEASETINDIEVERQVFAEEDDVAFGARPLPFADNSLEAVVSSMALHWVNDLPGVLHSVHNALKPDGCFMGAMLGGETLFELRTALQLADQERHGGIRQHISPMTDTRDVGSLMSRAGFTLLTVDIDELTVGYPSMMHLMQDLRAMGESNAVLKRDGWIGRDTIMAAEAIYKEMYGDPTDGSIPATFQIIYMIGWKPSESQPKPLERGSGTVSLKDVL